MTAREAALVNSRTSSRPAALYISVNCMASACFTSGTLRMADTADMFVKLPEGQRLPEKITELTGITDAILEAEGVSEADAAARFTRPAAFYISVNCMASACFTMPGSVSGRGKGQSFVISVRVSLRSSFSALALISSLTSCGASLRSSA